MTEREQSENNELLSPPSIGSKDISFDIVGNRARQIVENVVNKGDKLGAILQNAEQFGRISNATRIIVRVFLNNRSLELKNVNGFRQEAIIPLDGEFKELSLCYYGMNSLGRQTTDSVIEQEEKILDNVLDRQPKTPLAIFERTEGFRLERLRGELTPLDYERLREMYKLSFTDYPFDIGNVIRTMAKDAGYVVYAARSKTDGQLYAVCVTEEMVLNLADGRRFVMREMGDSAKMPEVNGLNAPLKLMLIQKALQNGVDLVFCESRAALGAVNAVNHDIGMQYCGFLPQHTRIGGEGIDEKSIYGNMNVWALNKDGIQRIGQEVKSLTP